MRVLAFSLLAATVAGCGGGGGGGSTTSGGSLPPVTPSGPNFLVPAAGSIYLGAFVNTAGTTVPSTAPMLATFEQQIGRKMQLSMHYHGWNEQFPNADEADDAANGRTPVISWNCGASNAQVANGSQDAIIAHHADALAAYGRPVFLRYMWEMNLPDTANNRLQCYDPGTDVAGGLFSPTEFIAAWQHIRGIFASRGVTNVAWVWNPDGNPNYPFAPYYPGGSQTDWVGIDQYDVSSLAFADTFLAYGQITGYGKPILIGETGAHPALQPAFLAAAATTLQTTYPQVKGFMYFDAAGSFDDWRLTPAGIAAFGAMAANPYFSATVP